MIEVEIYARDLWDMGKILELDRHFTEMAGLRYKVVVEFPRNSGGFPQARPSTAFYRRDSDGASVANEDGAAERRKCDR